MPNKVLTAPIRFYKFLISPLLGSKCRFHPSCSDYAREALERHGTVKGLLLAAWRVLRCNPWHNAKRADPVPERFDWRGFFRYKRPEAKNSAKN